MNTPEGFTIIEWANEPGSGETARPKNMPLNHPCWVIDESARVVNVIVWADEIEDYPVLACCYSQADVFSVNGVYRWDDSEWEWGDECRPWAFMPLPDLPGIMNCWAEQQNKGG